MKWFRKAATALVAVAVVFSPPAANAQDVNIFPLRAVLDDRDRSAEVTVYNRSGTAGTYRVELADKRMLETGVLETFGESNPTPAGWPSATDFIRFSPRQVTLAPGQSQSIRIAVRRPPDLAAGEYRAHLVVTAVPPANAGQTVEQATGLGENEIRVQITPIYGVSIPIIVRTGDVSARASLTAARIVNESGRQMEVTIERNGNASVYGDLVVLWRGSGGERQIGRARGLAVYPEIGRRLARIPLDPEALRGASGGATVIRYVENSEISNSPVLAEIQGPPL